MENEGHTHHANQDEANYYPFLSLKLGHEEVYISH